MRWLKVGFLLAVMLHTSGYRFRCYWMCTNQTSTQNDYVEQRNRCRAYAESKMAFAMKGKPGDEKTRKATLVGLFGECMAANGWNVGGDTKPAAPAPTPAPVPTQANAQEQAERKASISRSSECAFARHSASISSNAAARARACDIECAQRLSAAPDAPRPAACPSGPNPSLEKGRDSEGDQP